MNAFPLLTILTAVPLIGAFLVLVVGTQNRRAVRGVALSFSLVALAVALILWHGFNSASGELQFEELHAWIPAI
jgi:NADH-quinone oxidoreductase subunit M